VILDADLAKLYGVTTKRLNQQVNRNRNRFPDDFIFQITSEEKTEVVANKYASTVLGAHHGRLTLPNDRGYQAQKAISEDYSNIDWDAE
jgi:hypothetical protein